MTKIKKETIQQQIYGLLSVAILAILISWIVCIYQYSKLISEMNFNFHQPAIIKIHHHYSTTIEYTNSKEDRIKEYVKREVNKAGLDGDKAVRMIGECENPQWDEKAYYVNKGGTVDRGIWQINDYFHKKISNECSFDFECSTQEAIKILKKRGWCEWTCGKKLGFCK